jgi:predicted nucleic acid-binding protein
MSNYKVLIDSSVWINYFRTGQPHQLDRLIEEDLVCTNEVILTELIPYTKIANQDVLAETMESLESIPFQIDWPIIREYQRINLLNGINKVGIPDLIILQQVIFEKLTLFSHDKQFKIMQEKFHFDLMS